MDHEDLLDGRGDGKLARGKRGWKRELMGRGGGYRDVGDGATDGLDQVTMGLGFFRGEQQVARWGIELEPAVHGNPRHPYRALGANEET